MTASFLTPLRTEKIGAQRWLLTDDLKFRSSRYPGIFVAPYGFQTDLASIPRIAWSIFPKVDRYDAAAVIHDAAYANALVTDQPLADRRRIYCVKDVADHLFYEGLVTLGVRAWRARFMYRFVSLLGDPQGHPLAAHRKEIISV